MSVKTALATKVGKPIARFGRKVGSKAVANAPTLLIFTGIALVTGATVAIIKSSKKAAEAFDEFAAERESLEKTIEREAQVSANEEIFSRNVTDPLEMDYILHKYRKKVKKAYGKALRKIYWKLFGKLLRIYLFKFLLWLIGVILILGSHRMMLTRLAGVTALYKGSEEAFAQYRQNVIDDLGEEADLKYRYGIQNYEFQGVETDKNGKEKKVTETKAIAGKGSPNEFKFCRQTTNQYTGNDEYDMSMLEITRSQLINDISDGKDQYLNDLLGTLGMKKIYPQGQVAKIGPNGFTIHKAYEPVEKDGVHQAEGGKAKFDTVYYLDIPLITMWDVVEAKKECNKKEA